MSFSPSPTKSRSSYVGTPQHLKTLDILGRSKNFAKLSKEDLALYCELGRSNHSCESAADASVFLENRYGWDVESRMHDIEEAWKMSESNIDDDDDDTVEDSKAAATTSTGTADRIQQTEIPIIIKAGCHTRLVLICEVDDDALVFAGDSGAVGRIFCDVNSLRLDLKGRQYSGQITTGPTLMVLNLAAPVGQSASGNVCARAEVVTNEFCHLEFEKDLHSSMQGVYTGNDGDNNDLFERDDVGADSDAEVQGRKGKGSTKKTKEAAGGESGKLKISTITQRKRKSSAKGAGSSKKSGSAAKKPKS